MAVFTLDFLDVYVFVRLCNEGSFGKMLYGCYENDRTGEEKFADRFISCSRNKQCGDNTALV